MRHVLTQIIAFHWMAVFALLAIMSTLNPQQGIFAALTFLGAAPTPDAYAWGGGAVAAGFFSFAFAVASVLFLWTLATAFFGGIFPNGDFEPIARLAFGSGIFVVSLLLLGGASMPIPGLFVTSAIVIAALLASYLAVFAERWAVSMNTAPNDSDLRAAARVMAAGAAHSAMLGAISGRAHVATTEAVR